MAAFIKSKQTDFESLSKLHEMILKTKPSPANNLIYSTASSLPTFFSRPNSTLNTNNPGSLSLPWYSCNDILKYLDASIINDLGGFSTGCKHLLNNQFKDIDGKNYYVATIDAIDTDGGVPISFFFDSDQQAKPDPGMTDHRQDVFNE